jgi:hypothetical protein
MYGDPAMNGRLSDDRLAQVSGTAYAARRWVIAGGGERVALRSGRSDAGLRGVTRNAVIAVSSFMLVVAAAAYLATPPTAALATSVTPAGAWHGRPGCAVIYGKAATLDGDAIADLRIVISSVRNPRHVVAVMDTGQDGTYRQEVLIRAGRYKVSIGEGARGHFKHLRRIIFLEPGWAYRIDVQAKRHGGFWLIPVSSY